MKKVGIVTIIDNNNYGNRLQNYALAKYLNKLNVKAITLKNEKFFNHRANLKQKIISNKISQQRMSVVWF